MRERIKKTIRNKTVSLMLVFVLVATVVLGSAAYAATQGELQQDLSGVQSEKNEVSQRLEEVKSQINVLQPKVDSLNAEIATANSQILQTEQALANKQEEIKNREDGLNERLKVMYKNGSVGFLDVLLGSSSISEFISNLEMIQRIYKNDMEVLETLEQEQEELAAIEEDLKTQKADLDAKKAELDADVAELNTYKSELEAQEDALLEQARNLTQQIQQMTNSNSPYVGGVFVWPAPASYYITSYFGWRIHPVYGTWKYHSGIDIAAGRNTNVLAAGGGTVILSQSGYGGYGNCIIIDHGGGITSLYGHMQSRLVSRGQTVVAGEVIGKVGSTGVSTGPHLHFEVRKNGVLDDPLSYLS